MESPGGLVYSLAPLSLLVYQCVECGLHYTDPGAIIHHVYTQHPDERPVGEDESESDPSLSTVHRRCIPDVSGGPHGTDHTPPEHDHVVEHNSPGLNSDHASHLQQTVLKDEPTVLCVSEPEGLKDSSNLVNEYHHDSAKQPYNSNERSGSNKSTDVRSKVDADNKTAISDSPEHRVDERLLHEQNPLSYGYQVHAEKERENLLPSSGKADPQDDKIDINNTEMGNVEDPGAPVASLSTISREDEPVSVEGLLSSPSANQSHQGANADEQSMANTTEHDVTRHSYNQLAPTTVEEMPICSSMLTASAMGPPDIFIKEEPLSENYSKDIDGPEAESFSSTEISGSSKSTDSVFTLDTVDEKYISDSPEPRVDEILLHDEESPLSDDDQVYTEKERETLLTRPEKTNSEDDERDVDNNETDSVEDPRTLLVSSPNMSQQEDSVPVEGTLSCQGANKSHQGPNVHGQIMTSTLEPDVNLDSYSQLVPKAIDEKPICSSTMTATNLAPPAIFIKKELSTEHHSKDIEGPGAENFASINSLVKEHPANEKPLEEIKEPVAAKLSVQNETKPPQGQHFSDHTVIENNISNVPSVDPNRNATREGSCVQYSLGHDVHKKSTDDHVAEDVKQILAKPPLNFDYDLTKLESTSLVASNTGCQETAECLDVCETIVKQEDVHGIDVACCPADLEIKTELSPACMDMSPQTTDNCLKE